MMYVFYEADSSEPFFFPLRVDEAPKSYPDSFADPLTLIFSAIETCRLRAAEFDHARCIGPGALLCCCQERESYAERQEKVRDLWLELGHELRRVAHALRQKHHVGYDQLFGRN